MKKLPDPQYLSFPFKVEEDWPVMVGREDHVRQIVEQVLFTSPRERVFRPDFGAGLKNLVFEPNSSTLWEITKKRLLSTLIDALAGEVDPDSLEISVDGEGEHLNISVVYVLARIGQRQICQYQVK